MIRLPEASHMKALAIQLLRPRTRWGRTALWSGGLALLLIVKRWITGSASGSLLSGWAIFFLLICAFCSLRLAIRWARRRLMWRLRHRLIITYIFIGVIPILLLLVVAGMATYLCAWQFSTYVTTSELQSSLQHLSASNRALAEQLSALDHSGKLNDQVAGELITASGENFPQRSVTIWRGGVGSQFAPGNAASKAAPLRVPDEIKGDFTGFVLDGDQLHLRVVKRYDEDGHALTVISNVPLTPELLEQASARVGSVTLLPPSLQITLGGQSTAKNSEDDDLVVAGRVPTPVNRLDLQLHYYGGFTTTNWEKGKSDLTVVRIVTRPSMLLRTLFTNLGDNAVILWWGVLQVAVLFGLIEFVALYIGIRLSRSMTLAVANLYSATEHVNRGDLTHRIEVREHDQMAALEESFNSMTESLVKLLDEQKQKQRMENELALAYEVQDLLFPSQMSALDSLETFGVCRPARSVSGDYYDFIPLSTESLMLAMGDISGKGISAALLMASVHAFFRAYSQVPGGGLPATALEIGVSSQGGIRILDPEEGASQSQLSPATLMAAMNDQLYNCTPQEKYATMFLACYDAAERELRYCNAGHLPPIILSVDGTISRLEATGTVIGLFDSVTYEESTVSLQPGDLLVAFSDGVTEPENEFGEFGEDRLISLLRENRYRPLSEIGQRITAAVADWIGEAEQPDDVTVVLARAR